MSAHAVRFHGLRVVARYKETDETKGTCDCCGGDTRRSHITHILHPDCYWCRHLKMVYGPNIRVTRRKA